LPQIEGGGGESDTVVIPLNLPRYTIQNDMIVISGKQPFGVPGSSNLPKDLQAEISGVIPRYNDLPTKESKENDYLTRITITNTSGERVGYIDILVDRPEYYSGVLQRELGVQNKNAVVVAADVRIESKYQGFGLGTALLGYAEQFALDLVTRATDRGYFPEGTEVVRFISDASRDGFTTWYATGHGYTQMSREINFYKNLTPRQQTQTQETPGSQSKTLAGYLRKILPGIIGAGMIAFVVGLLYISVLVPQLHVPQVATLPPITATLQQAPTETVDQISQQWFQSTETPVTYQLPTETATAVTQEPTALPTRDVRQVAFGSEITKPHFHALGVNNPYSSIPDWFYTQILPRLKLAYTSLAEYQTAFSRLTIVNHVPLYPQYELDSQYQVDKSELKSVSVAAPGETVLMRNDAVDAVTGFVKELRSLGYQVYVTSGYRSYEEQASIRAQEGANSALPGQSQHQGGYAFDIQMIDKNGRRVALGYSAKITAVAHKYGIVHPYTTGWLDPPHYFYLDGMADGLTKSLIEAGIDPDRIEVINQVLLGIGQQLEFRIMELKAAQSSLPMPHESSSDFRNCIVDLKIVPRVWAAESYAINLFNCGVGQIRGGFRSPANILHALVDSWEGDKSPLVIIIAEFESNAKDVYVPERLRNVFKFIADTLRFAGNVHENIKWTEYLDIDVRLGKIQNNELVDVEKDMKVTNFAKIKHIITGIPHMLATYGRLIPWIRNGNELGFLVTRFGTHIIPDPNDESTGRQSASVSKGFEEQTQSGKHIIVMEQNDNDVPYLYGNINLFNSRPIGYWFLDNTRLTAMQDTKVKGAWAMFAIMTNQVQSFNH